MTFLGPAGRGGGGFGYLSGRAVVLGVLRPPPAEVFVQAGDLELDGHGRRDGGRRAAAAVEERRRREERGGVVYVRAAVVVGGDGGRPEVRRVGGEAHGAVDGGAGRRRALGAGVVVAGEAVTGHGGQGEARPWLGSPTGLGTESISLPRHQHRSGTPAERVVTVSGQEVCERAAADGGRRTADGRRRTADGGSESADEATARRRRAPRGGAIYEPRPPARRDDVSRLSSLSAGTRAQE